MRDGTGEAQGHENPNASSSTMERVTREEVGGQDKICSGLSGPGPDAWTMAALAHASILLTVVLAFAGGVGALLGLTIPLVIYLSYRGRSRYIAYHALQAIVYQGVGLAGYLVLVLVFALIVTAAWTIVGLLSAVAVGFLLMPAALLMTSLMAIVILLAPLTWVGYGLYAAYEVYQGGHFRYISLGEWVERKVRL